MGTGVDQERVFAAIAVKGNAQAALAAWSARIQQQYSFRKWTSEADYHITLQFYGDVDRTRLPELSKMLAAVASTQSPFALRLGEAGYFGLPERPRVLWIDPAGERSALASLQRDIVDASKMLGYQTEARAYHPHITVARKYAGNENMELHSLPTCGNELSEVDWNVEHIALYCTRMGQIPMYELAGCFPLTGDRLL